MLVLVHKYFGISGERTPKEHVLCLLLYDADHFELLYHVLELRALRP